MVQFQLIYWNSLDSQIEYYPVLGQMLNGIHYAGQNAHRKFITKAEKKARWMPNAKRPILLWMDSESSWMRSRQATHATVICELINHYLTHKNAIQTNK